MKSLKLRISALAIMMAIGAIGVTFTSCQKDVRIGNESLNELVLSKNIQELDDKVKNNKATRAVDWRKVWGYAKSDGVSAYATYKFIGKYFGPGYGAGVGLLGGIAGSLLHAWETGDLEFSTGPGYIPPGGSIGNIDDITSPHTIGVLHNNILNEATNGSSTIQFSNIDNLMSTSYDYFTQRVAEELNLDITTLRSKISLVEYKVLANSKNASIPVNVITEVNNGASVNICNYLNEYFSRVTNSNATFDDIKQYTDLFIADVENQSHLNSDEKFNITATLSIFKNSSLFWDNL